MAAAVLGVLCVPFASAPAYAASDDFKITSVSSFELAAGGSHTVSVTVSAGTSGTPTADGSPMTAQLVIEKSGGSPSTDFTLKAGGACEVATTDGSCNFSFADGAVLTWQVTAVSPITDVPPGTKASFNGSSVSVSDNTNSNVSSFTVTLDGPAPPKPAKITGDVYDITTGQPVSNALVDLQDTANHSYTTRTNSKGQFQYIDQPPTNIAAGTIYIGATKSGFQPLVGQGQVFTKGTDLAYGRLRIHPVAAPTVSATTPTPTFSSAPPSTPESGAPSGSGSVAAIGTGGGSAAASGGLGGMFQFILIGGVALIVGGIVVVAYMFFKRRRDDLGGDPLDEPDGDDGGGGYGTPSYDRPPPPRRVMPEPTMVVRPRIADAPTMMHAPAGGYPPQRAPVDPYQPEYSPAGYPPPRGPSYDPNFPASGQGGAYGSPPRSPYPEQGYGQPYGQPAYPPPAGYGSPGSPGGGYAPEAGYGSSGGYGGQHGSSGGYGGGGSSGGYGGQGGSYGSSGGYGGGQGGYGSSGGYGGQHGSAGGYDQGYQSQQGYDRRGYADQGYDQGYGGGGGGYDQGYGTQPGYGGQQSHGGYDQRGYNAGGYDQNGYDQNGYDQNGYDANGYNAEGYHVNGYSQYPGEYDSRSSAPPSSPSGYRGGYVPPEQRGNVDWLDD